MRDKRDRSERGRRDKNQEYERESESGGEGEQIGSKMRELIIKGNVERRANAEGKQRERKKIIEKKWSEIISN